MIQASNGIKNKYHIYKVEDSKKNFCESLKEQ